mmetsp:Transcript_19417/g.23913  ORF Transcript_19417/g.23913 Transcript_19417/m.23913 type:complete len:255 (-) Transcript_19417:1667-2431(-)
MSLRLDSLCAMKAPCSPNKASSSSSDDTAGMGNKSVSCNPEIDESAAARSRQSELDMNDTVAIGMHPLEPSLLSVASASAALEAAAIRSSLATSTVSRLGHFMSLESNMIPFSARLTNLRVHSTPSFPLGGGLQPVVAKSQTVLVTWYEYHQSTEPRLNIERHFISTWRGLEGLITKSLKTRGRRPSSFSDIMFSSTISISVIASGHPTTAVSAQTRIIVATGACAPGILHPILLLSLPTFPEEVVPLSDLLDL